MGEGRLDRGLIAAQIRGEGAQRGRLACLRRDEPRVEGRTVAVAHQAREFQGERARLSQRVQQRLVRRLERPEYAVSLQPTTRESTVAA